MNRTILRIYVAVLISFVLNKFLLRPFVLENVPSEILKVFVLSYPNFCEAVVGSLLLATIGLTLKQRSALRNTNVSKSWIYTISVILAGMYVILQEFKIHNLGGRNTYDPYDVVFSVLGLIVGYIILVKVQPAPEMEG